MSTPDLYIGLNMNAMNQKPGNGQAEAGKNQRAERLAEALRENLRKRKAQSRARSGTVGGVSGISKNGPQNDTDCDEES